MCETDDKARELFVIDKAIAQIAKRMIVAGSNNIFISEMTDLTMDEIDELRRKL